MNPVCQLPTSDAIFRSAITTTDCVIADRVAQAYAVLHTPDGSFTQISVLLLTIYVAVVGYRLVLGHATLTLAKLVPHFVKIGVVIALITSWPGYQTLVFNLLFHGPEELATAVAGTSSANGAVRGDVLDALQNSYDRLTAVAAEAWARHPVPAAEAAKPADPFASAAPDAAPGGLTPPSTIQLGSSQFAAALLWISAFVMVATSIGLLLVLRIVLALLFLVGPLFVLAGLFAATQGLLEGWLRVAVRYALAPLFITLGSAGLVVVLAPLITKLEVAPQQPETETVLAIALIIAVFAAVLLQAAELSGGIARGIRLPRKRTPVVAPIATPAVAITQAAATDIMQGRSEALVDAIGRATEGSKRRERGIEITPSMGDRRSSNGRTAGDLPAAISGRLGQNYPRTSVVERRSPPVERDRTK